jgi:hypothetical protein
MKVFLAFMLLSTSYGFIHKKNGFLKMVMNNDYDIIHKYKSFIPKDTYNTIIQNVLDKK